VWDSFAAPQLEVRFHGGNVLNNDIYQMEQRCTDRHNELAEHINRINHEQAKVQVEQNIEIIKEIVSHTYDKANAYSNLIIAAGYVGFFTLWTSLKKDLPDWAILASGTLILLSMMTFIGFEIYKMISGAVHMHKVTNRLQSPTMDALMQIQELEQQANLRNARVWIYTVIPTVISGFLAGFVLLFCFLASLFSPYFQ
jgi:hypothetical protein